MGNVSCVVAYHVLVLNAEAVKAEKIVVFPVDCRANLGAYSANLYDWDSIYSE